MMMAGPSWIHCLTRKMMMTSSMDFLIFSAINMELDWIIRTRDHSSVAELIHGSKDKLKFLFLTLRCTKCYETISHGIDKLYSAR